MYLPSGDKRLVVTPQLALRVAILGGVALALFAIAFFRLWYLQILSGDRSLAEANNNRVRELKVEAPRGKIVDRNGTLLVDNRTALAVQVSPDSLPANSRIRAREIRRLSRVLGLRPRSVERKIRHVRALMAGIDNVYFNIKSERHSFYQALLSLGDRRVAPVIEAAERNGGNWRAAAAEADVDAAFFVFRDRTNDRVLPWDIIDGGMKDDFFRSEFQKAMREEWTLPPKRQKENARLLPVLP